MLGEREKERLTKNLDFFAGELGDYRKFTEYTWNDYKFDRDKRRNIERWIENLTKLDMITRMFITSWPSAIHQICNLKFTISNFQLRPSGRAM